MVMRKVYKNMYILKKGQALITPLRLLILSILSGTFLISSNTSAATHTLTLTSSGSQSINVSASSGTAISSDSINVATTCRYGYNFTLSTSVSNNNLYLNGNSSNNASGTYFSPVDGTTALNAATNKWGYYYNSNASNTPTSTSVFSPVPTLSSPATIRTPLTTPASSNINDNFKIYYGVNSAPSMSVGTYKMIPDTNNSNNDGTLVYTATIADTCIAYTVHYDPSGIFEGQTITGTGTVADQTMYEGVATNLTNSYFTGPTISGTTYYFTGWNTAQDGSGTAYTRGQSVIDLTTVGNTITLYAQWTDCPGDTICYDNNGATGPIVNNSIATTANHSIGSTKTSIDYLHPPNYYRTNYGFLGWSTIKMDPNDSDYATKFSNATSAGKVFGPNESINIIAGQYNNSGLKLYAVWLPKSTSYTMQTFTETRCSDSLTEIVYENENNSPSLVTFTTKGKPSITLDSFIALQDARDNNVYTVAKLTDGNCWMLENLRLEANSTIGNTNKALAQGYRNDPTYGNFLGLADAENANFDGTIDTPNESITANSIYYAGTLSGTATIDITQTNFAASRIPRYNNSNTQSTAASSLSGNNTYSYGNYYTWPAAMANTAYYNSKTSTDSDGDTSETAGTSICPTGWMLPYGGITDNGNSSGGFTRLSTSMGGANASMNSSSTPTGEIMSKRLRQFPNNYVYSGWFYQTSAQSRGNTGATGHYLSSTAMTGGNHAYILYIGTNRIYLDIGDKRAIGNSIRCLITIK